MIQGKPYDPAWLIKLAKEQLPNQPEIADALKRCTASVHKTKGCVYFVSPEAPNEPGSEWQFDVNEVLECPKVGDVVLDVLKDGRIGGIEILRDIPQG